MKTCSIATTRALCFMFAAVLLSNCAASHETASDTFEHAVASAVADLCDERLVLMGEASDHGRGEALAVKARIARDLIKDCGFDTVLFESGYYDFSKLYLDRRSDVSVSQDDLSSSIGGIWNQYAEVADLVPFLTAGVNAGDLVVGGLDFNLGSAGAFYSIDAMPADMARLLDADSADACARRVRQLIYFSYGRDGPQPSHIDEISRCADAMISALDAAGASDLEAAVLRAMIINMRAYAQSRLVPRDQHIQAREQAFFDNFIWWRSQLPADAKIIVWGASVHVAKTASGLELFREVETFGALVNESLGDRAHFLNFTAVSGSYRFLDREEQPIPEPQPGSVEALHATMDGYRYLDRDAVAALGVRPSSIYGRAPVTEDISTITDSLIVIARERPPGYLH